MTSRSPTRLGNAGALRFRIEEMRPAWRTGRQGDNRFRHIADISGEAARIRDGRQTGAFARHCGQDQGVAGEAGTGLGDKKRLRRNGLAGPD